jgi:hypothetical protein
MKQLKCYGPCELTYHGEGVTLDSLRSRLLDQSPRREQARQLGSFRSVAGCTLARWLDMKETLGVDNQREQESKTPHRIRSGVSGSVEKLLFPTTCMQRRPCDQQSLVARQESPAGLVVRILPRSKSCPYACWFSSDANVHTNSIIEEAGFPKMQQTSVLISVHAPQNVVRSTSIPCNK